MPGKKARFSIMADEGVFEARWGYDGRGPGVVKKPECVVLSLDDFLRRSTWPLY
jgi:hypothetical protein